MAPSKVPRTLREAVAAWGRDPRWSLVHDGKRRAIVTLERGLLATGIAVFATGLLGALAAGLGWFRAVAPLVLFAWVLAVALLAWMAVKRRIAWVGDRYDAVALVVGAFAALSAGLLHHLYFQGQMDIGFYIHDAHTIATTGGRDLHGPHDDLIPGVREHPDGSRRMEVMYGYSALGAFFGYVGGIEAIPWVNGILAPLLSVAVYVVARRLGAAFGAILAQLLHATSLLSVWFQRWVMSENLAATIFWISVVLALPLLRHWDRWRVGGLAIALSYGALVRPEGALVALWVVAVLAVAQRPYSWAAVTSFWKRPRQRRLVAVAAAIAVLVAIATGPSIVRSLPKGYLQESFAQASSIRDGVPLADAADVPTTGPGPNWGDYALRYEWESAVAYALPWFLFLAVVSIALGLVDRRLAGTVAVLGGPYLLFVFMPPVTTFHPWFMRRLWMFLVPLLYVVGAACLDAGRLVRRWPRLRSRATPRLIVGALIIAAFVVHLDVVAPVAFERESDGSGAALASIHAALPAEATIVGDDDVTGYVTGLRFRYGRDAVPSFLAPTQSFVRAFEAESKGEKIFLIGIESRLPLPQLRTDEQGTVRVKEFPVRIEYPARENHRAYLSQPPLEHGYEPLARYLDRDVPPNNMIRIQVNLTLREAAQPLVLQKGCFFNVAEWERTPDGMRALSANASIVIDPNWYSADARQNQTWGLRLVFEGAEAPLVHATRGGRSAEAPFLHHVSPITQDLRLAQYLLPNLTMEGFAFDAGVTLRGSYVGVWGT